MVEEREVRVESRNGNGRAIRPHGPRGYQNLMPLEALQCGTVPLGLCSSGVGRSKQERQRK